MMKTAVTSAAVPGLSKARIVAAILLPSGLMDGARIGERVIVRNLQSTGTDGALFMTDTFV
jgi:hypothetical protein